MGKEFELKYSATPEQQLALVADFGDFSEIAMETTYYDTADGAFADRKLTLRRRLENGLSVCTLKAPAGINSRREWEIQAQSIEEAIPELCKLSKWEEPGVLAAKGLIPVCGARFTRLAKTVDLTVCTVEIAVDKGVLVAGEKQIPLCEIEVELKSGREGAAVAFGENIAQRYGLQTEPKSKFRRALALAKG